MSASPSGQTSGPTSGRTPNGGPAPRRRKPQAADPLRRPPNRNRPRQPLTSTAIGATTNGLPTVGNGKLLAKSALNSISSKAPATLQTLSLSTVLTGGGEDTSGFSSAPMAPYTDYPLVTTKRALIEGRRYHIARFASKKVVNPTDEEEFTRPVRLQRRDPRAPLAGAGGNLKDEDTKEGLEDGVADDREREKQEILRAEREKQREENLAQIAPTGGKFGRTYKKPNAFNQKKTQQAFDKEDDHEAAAQKKLKYEESLPWHLEDFDNKNTWVGNYEAALSGTYAMLQMQPNQTIRMTRLSKWYKFNSKNQFKTLTIEEAELRMKKPIKEPRWFMDSQKASEDRKAKEKTGIGSKGLFLGKDLGNESGTTVTDPTAGVIKSEQPADADDLDYEEDRFADDEENKLFEADNDEEIKEAEERIKRDQLQANFFDQKDEKQYDQAEDEEKKEKELEKDLGKGVKKALKKREKNYIYDSDSDNPYAEKSESEDSDAEAARLKEEERKKEEDKKAAAEKEKEKGRGKEVDKPSSGASTKGTNTPSHRPKPTQSTKKSTKNLKRPGSPNLSEASGTESGRKKTKKSHHQSSSSHPTGTSTPRPSNLSEASGTESGRKKPEQSQLSSKVTGTSSSRPTSRATSPAPPSSSAPDSGRAQTQTQKSSTAKAAAEPARLNEVSSAPSRADGKRPRPKAGSGSDAEATGGEMSDGARKKRIKLRVGGSPTNGTPQGSRAASPDIAPAGNQQRVSQAANGVRAGSPAAAASTDGTRPPTTTARPESPNIVTAEEIVKAIPPNGTTIAELLPLFRGRVGNKARFIDLVKANSKLSNGRLYLKNASA